MFVWKFWVISIQCERPIPDFTSQFAQILSHGMLLLMKKFILLRPLYIPVLIPTFAIFQGLVSALLDFIAPSFLPI